MRSHLLTLSLAASLSLGSAGCIKKVLLDGQIQGTRMGAIGVDSIPDYELGRNAAIAGLAQFEGMHVLGPDNTDALYLLAKTWTAYGFAFVEDDLQAAQDAGDDDLAEYHKKRARNAYDRAIFFGLELLSQKASGFEQARKNQSTLTKWLAENFTEKRSSLLVKSCRGPIQRADLVRYFTILAAAHSGHNLLKPAHLPHLVRLVPPGMVRGQS